MAKLTGAQPASAVRPGKISTWQKIDCGVVVEALFENMQLNAGNLVKLEGGCATVTGYKLPGPLSNDGKAEARFEA